MGRQRSIKRRGWPAHLYDNPGGYYYYVNPITGKKKGLGKDKARAFSEARAANAAVVSMRESSLVAWVQGKQDHTLLTWLPTYEEMWVRETKPAEGTLDAAQRFFERFKKADFAWMPLHKVTTAHVAAYLDQLLMESTASVTINMRARLHDVFRLAMTKGLIDTGMNPVTSTTVPEYKVMRDRLSLEQYLAVRAAAPKWIAAAMDLALLTAQRREDVANMKFSDVRDGYLFVTQGKTGMKLQQDLNIRLDAVNLSIDDVIKNCRDRVVSKFIVHHHRTSGNYRAGDQFNPNGLTSAFATARAKAKIKCADGKTMPTLHEIRSLAERLYLQQYGAEFAQAMLGHKNARMTAEYHDLRGSGWNVINVK